MYNILHLTIRKKYYKNINNPTPYPAILHTITKNIEK